MASIPLSDAALSSVKKALRCDYPDIGSSHLSEALAAALGFRTHAALLEQAREITDDPVIMVLDDLRFDSRLQSLGYSPDPEFSFELLNAEGLIYTKHLSSYDIQYRSVRSRAWRNLMICAINEGIRQKLFSIRPFDNRWISATVSNRPYQDFGAIFGFQLPNGLPANGYVGDAGFGELSIHVAVNPKGDWVKASNAGFYAGDAFATGWLERQKGAWLQSSPEMLNCRKTLVKTLSDIDIDPLGYGDRGKVIF